MLFPRSSGNHASRRLKFQPISLSRLFHALPSQFHLDASANTLKTLTKSRDTVRGCEEIPSIPLVKNIFTTLNSAAAQQSWHRCLQRTSVSSRSEAYHA